MAILVVFIGGGVGSVLRFLVGKGVSKFASSFISAFCVSPVLSSVLATFIVNALGSFVLGFLSVLFLYKFSMAENLRLLLMVGLCGGFTTFSTFSLDVINLFKFNLSYAFIYIFITLFVSIFLAFLGILLAQNIALSLKL
ncbi:hypothetical protein BKH43_01465 [Helicobacter sp. 13S00401-1]|uniref:fluoride efflux transporter FluC n=1 Tax=Helicobacter sp. 13S00401-1 TaxID=1905758 RepID=UPI000BA6BB4A|nr:CrcB family protein [Helicobacter sp. 13S00401-1]PAF51334.1 hypothetical protein BKH43_01465 [Helicobacter sp. 13S00401-1]